MPWELTVNQFSEAYKKSNLKWCWKKWDKIMMGVIDHVKESVFYFQGYGKSLISLNQQLIKSDL